MKRQFILIIAAAVSVLTLDARERIRFDEGWEFAFGNASSPALDFGCGTEYFNYLTKAASIHNEGPYSPKFDKSKWAAEWTSVTLPHDWVVDLPFAKEASHSHGYKTVGHKYPETSVGWYRKTFPVRAEDEGRHFTLQFDGIFRNADIWVNGFWLGKEPSGYATQVHDISEYLDYGGDNLVCVRVDASLEEGWFYEGAGIYRHVWMEITDPVHVAPHGTFVHADVKGSEAEVTVATTVRNSSVAEADYTLRHSIIDAEGQSVAECTTSPEKILAKADGLTETVMSVPSPNLWDLTAPYCYTLRTEVLVGGEIHDTYDTPFGIRSIAFDADEGFFLNGKRTEIKGVNLHQDHAGVGTSIPDALQVYRLKELKKIGVNAIRTSHNPATPELLDACDSLGILVMEENRLTGVNDEHIRLLKRMIERDRNHPSIILWSIGNEEWGTEWNDKGTKITASMREYCHRLDPTRLMAVASSSGPNILVTADVAGYNYIRQHKIDELREQYPGRMAVGSEETTGCGTRGIYFDDEKNGRMASLNRRDDTRDSTFNVMGKSWRYYEERPWLGGLFWWTGFDYRGEPNPLSFPATGSEFGILDYCGFPKDEAFYLKAWWTDEPVLHIFPHWNLQGHEGEKISIWVYGNCDEVELTVGGKRLGRKKMEHGGYLSWDAVYRPGTVRATGYRNGRRILTRTIETTGPASTIVLSSDRPAIKADGQDVAVCTISLEDSKGRFVPDACEMMEIRVDGPVRILGVGNGDPAWQDRERPDSPDARSFRVRTFNGLAQVLLQSTHGSGRATLTVTGAGNTSNLTIDLQ